MKNILFIAFIGLLALGTAKAQRGPTLNPEQLTRLDAYEDTIALLAYAVVNDSLPEYRFGACQKLITSLKEALKTPNSFYYPFKGQNLYRYNTPPTARSGCLPGNCTST
ncbi:MAG: hypothetical protein IPN33_15030 [Saprospiraceae bacterium]|nr:hypothetical protein [Saprospiraceae bacterium]